MRPLLLCALLLVQGAAAAETHSSALAHPQHPQHPHPASSAHAGSELVEQALAKLAAVPNQPSLHEHRKPSLLASVAHLVARLVPSLSARAPSPVQSKESKENQQQPPPAIADAVRLLEDAAARHSNPDALFLLAEMNYYGNYSHPRNFPASFGYYHQLADGHGNTSAMYMMGLMYSTGIGAAVEPDQARALLYYTFAALRGHTRAEMVVAARHHAGIGAPKSCEEAVKYYKRVADKAMAWYRSGPLGSAPWVHQPYRIADESGGVYGEGASVVSSGINARRAQSGADAHSSIEDVIEYLDLLAQKGDFKAALNIGRLFYEGQRGLDRDIVAARRYFMLVAQRFWHKGARIEANPKPGLDKAAGKAAGYLGRINLSGEGMDGPNLERAKAWLDLGVSVGDAQSQHYLGLMYLKGPGHFVKNHNKAIELLLAAADQDFLQAQVELGVLHLDQGRPEDIQSANAYFEMAARYGYVEAYYFLAEMMATGTGRDRSCPAALAYYKSVAERADPLVSSWAEANAAYAAGDVELALLEYLEAAEQGYEKAQNNVAFLLDPQHAALPLKAKEKDHLLDNPRMGLMQYTRSSRQSNVDALVKMGDFYLAGLGAPASAENAAACYAAASDHQQSAQALYNLGWMHENGVGLDQDFHLAKRYYDSALAINAEAYLPVTLSLLKLRVRSAWNTLTHGHVNSIQDEPAPVATWSLAEWLDSFWNAEFAMDDFYDDLYGDDDAPYDDDGEFGLDDLGGLEPVALFGLVAVLALLVYYRRQRQREQEQQEQQQRARAQRDEEARRLMVF